MLLEYAVASVVTSSIGLPKLGSCATWNSYFRAPSTGDQRDVGWSKNVVPFEGPRSDGGADCFWKLS